MYRARGTMAFSALARNPPMTLGTNPPWARREKRRDLRKRRDRPPFINADGGTVAYRMGRMFSGLAAVVGAGNKVAGGNTSGSKYCWLVT
jgi:hypothetical protein